MFVCFGFIVSGVCLSIGLVQIPVTHFDFLIKIIDFNPFGANSSDDGADSYSGKISYLMTELFLPFPLPELYTIGKF